MRLPWFFIPIVLLAGAAWAQQQVLVPTRPFGDSSNAAASTAYVNSYTADTTATPGSGASKWNPQYFTNPGTGHIVRFNRIFCGESTVSSGDIGPVTTKDWLENLIANTTGAAMFVCVDTTGNLGVLGASRASDFRTVFGSSTGGAQGVTGVSYNDDTVGAAIVVNNMIGVAKSGALGITGAVQNDIDSAATTVDVLPFTTGIPAGATFANLMTSGAYSSISSTNVSAAWIADKGRSGGPQFRKGGLCKDGGLDTSVGAGTDGVCLEMARNQSVRWLNSGGTTDGEIWANAAGVKVNQALTANSLSLGSALTVANGGTGDTGTAWSTFTASPTCGSATITTNSSRSKTIGKTTFVEYDLNITALGTCTTAMTVNLPNTANSGAGLAGRVATGTNSGVGIAMQILSGGTTAAGGPSQQGGWATGQAVMSGVYENQ